MNANVTTVERPTGPSIVATMAERYSMTAQAFEQTLRATVVPREITREQFAAFLVICNEYGLNPLLKEIHAFPSKTGGIQPMVGIDGWVKLANSHPMMDGIEFDDHLDDRKQLTAISARIYRKDRSHPVVVTEYMAECKRNTDPWKQWPHRMLRHRALIQAVRYAFGYSNIFDGEEIERLNLSASPPPAPPPAAPSARQIAASPPHDEETGEIIDETGPGEGSATSSQDAKPVAEAAEAHDQSALRSDAPVTPVPPSPEKARPLDAEEKTQLKAFAQTLSSVNTPSAVQKAASRFYAEHDLVESSPIEVAANAISAAHLGRTRGEVSIADADAAVRKALS